MRPYSKPLSEMVAQLVGDRSIRDAAEVAGVNYALLQNIKKHGWIPSRETVRRMADGFELSGEARRELFAAAGYIEDPQALAGAAR